jgi:hypothetical protein
MMAAQDKHVRSHAWFDALWSHMAAGDDRGAFFVCDHEGAVVSAVVVLRHAKLVTYAHGASAAETSARFSKTIPPLVAAITWARDAGCDTFDLGGVPLESDTDAKRKAIALFKFDFSRTRVRLVHEHARWW